jgi:hypothetical protein
MGYIYVPVVELKIIIFTGFLIHMSVLKYESIFLMYAFIFYFLNSIFLICSYSDTNLCFPVFYSRDYFLNI